MRAPTVAFVIALGAGLLTGAGPVQVGAAAQDVGRASAVDSAVTTKAKGQGRPIRIVLTGFKRPQTIFAAWPYTCALDSAGKAWCWGDGSRGRLGDGDTDWHSRARPVAVVGGHTFTSLDAGETYTCALDTARKAWCWGDGDTGRLGDGDTSNHFTATPVAVVGGHTFTSLSAGENHTCGVAKNGKAWCWGDGANGRLGDGITKGHMTGTPVAVVGGHTLAQP